ncbi:MAG: glycosyltransferase [Candidatus Helarchaeota archaeon]
MKIGIFTDTYAQVNGVTITIKALEKNLRRMGHDVYIYAPRGAAGATKENPYLFTSEGFRFILSPEYRWAVFPVFTIPQSNLGLDVIHVHSPISMGLAGLINARRLGIPCVGSIHTLLPEFWRPFLERYIPYIKPPIFNKVISHLIKVVDRFSILDTTIDLTRFFMEELTWRYYTQFFKRCDIALVPSRYAQEECQKHGLNTEILPNGVDFSKFQNLSAHESTGAPWNLTQKDRVALYVGRLSEEKNIGLILESAAQVLKTTDHLKYLIVGDGPLRSQLEKVAEKYRIRNNVIFTGYLHQDMLNQAYARADLYINASPLETQGLSVIEAMYFGCPVLSINSGAVVDLFKDSSIGLLFENASDLSEKLKQLLNNQKLLESYRRNAKIKAQEYNIKKFCGKLIAIYERYL